MLHYWKFTNPLYNHQCDPISWSIITWKDIVLLFAKWIFLYNFTTFNPLIAIAPKFASLLQLQQENKRSLGHTTNLWNIFWNKAMIMEAVKSRYYLPLKKGVALHLNKVDSPSPMVSKCHVWLKLDQWLWSF